MRWSRWLSRAITLAFMAGVAFLLARKAHQIDIDEVTAAIAALPRASLSLAFVFVALSYLAHMTYELMARSYTGHHLGPAKVMLIAFICYAFNFNLGAWVGGIGFRYRLYSKFNVSPLDMGRILGFTILTGWVGFFLIAGLLFLFAPPPIPPDFVLSDRSFRLIGVALTAVWLGYIALCHFFRGREFLVRGFRVAVPSVGLALTQSLVASVHWLSMGMILWLIFRGVAGFAYTDVAGIYFVAAVAGLASHIPAGLGVIEAVFLAFLTPGVQPSVVLASVLAFRVIYYIVPLIIALLAYASLELSTRLSSGGSATPGRSGTAASRPST